MKSKRNRSAGIILKGKNLLLIHRINYGKEYYVFPGGGVEDGETSEQTVLREVKEETSLKVEVNKLLYHHVYDDRTEQFFYLCKYLSGEPSLGDANEAEEMQNGNDDFYDPVWCRVDDLSKLLLYPLEIRDWLIKDLEGDFANNPREQKIKKVDLRETL
jgi:mutator protein MutT